MRVLVTGARGFVGKNLCCALKNVRDGKDRREKYASLLPLEVMEYDVDSTPAELEDYCSRADFVFNLAGVNRPKDQSEFMEGNFGFASTLLDTLERYGNTCPVMLSSSAQASLSGRFEGSVYGESKLAGEGLFREYSDRTGATILIYRFPNLYGKWCRPRYNSAVATFCDAVANGRPYTVNDPAVELELLYIDDLVEEMLGALLGEEHRCGYEGLERVDGDDFCYVPKTDVKTLGEIVFLLDGFRDSRETLSVPDLSEGSFSKKLWSTFLSYYEPGNFAYSLKPNTDERGSFTEFLRTPERGQELGERLQARHHQGQPLAHEQVGEVPGGLRHRIHQAQEGGRGRRGQPVPRRRVHRLGFQHARGRDDPRLHALHHQPVRHRGPRDGHVGQRALRPRGPRHLPRGGLAAWARTVPISHSRTTAD